jgi:hypothetical protein
MQLLLCWILVLGWDWRRKERYPSSQSLSHSVCVCVFLSLFWCSYVILSKWEIGRQIVVAREDLTLQIQNKRWIHAGPRCCVISQALEVCLLPLPFLLLLLLLLVGLTCIPSICIQPTHWHSIFNNVKKLEGFGFPQIWDQGS